MKLLREINSTKLIKALKTYGYETTRQSGSHIRLTTQKNKQHHITIPKHDPLKIGTINAILTEVAIHFDISKQELLESLFKSH